MLLPERLWRGARVIAYYKHKFRDIVVWNQWKKLRGNCSSIYAQHYQNIDFIWQIYENTKYYFHDNKK
jgi:hypothetical protein